MPAPKSDRCERKAREGGRGSCGICQQNAAQGFALLRRYFFYWWLFRDASVGTYWERAAALAHNREHAGWLLRYVVRWIAITVLLLAVGRTCEFVFASQVLSAPFYLLAILALACNAVTVACWLLLHSGG